MRNYKELGVWQKAVGLVVETYKKTGRFPDTEKFGLTAQIRGSAASIPANIAEGWGRGSTREYVQFLLIARGSLMELETHLLIGQKLSYLSEEQLAGFELQIEEIGRMLNGLIQALRSRRSGSSPPTSP